MKIVKVSIMMIALILMIASCKKDKKENVINEPPAQLINVDNINALNRALQIEGATLYQGGIPDIEHVSPLNPNVKNQRKVVFTETGNEFRINFEFIPGERNRAYAGCLLKVADAGYYHHIPPSSSGNNIVIPIQLPEKLVGDSFEINYTVFDKAGFFSKQRSVMVSLSTKEWEGTPMIPDAPAGKSDSEKAPVEVPHK